MLSNNYTTCSHEETYCCVGIRYNVYSLQSK